MLQRFIVLFAEIVKSSIQPTAAEWWLQYIIMPGVMAILTTVLIVVTIYYAYSTARIARLTEETTRTTYRMVDETQRMAKATQEMAVQARQTAERSAELVEQTRKNYLAYLSPSLSFVLPAVHSKLEDRQLVVELTNEGIYPIEWIRLAADLADPKTGKVSGETKREFKERVIPRGTVARGTRWKENKNHKNLRVEVIDIAGQHWEVAVRQ